MGIDKELLDILVCPKCKGDLELSEKEDSLNCKPCSLRYPLKKIFPSCLLTKLYLSKFG